MSEVSFDKTIGDIIKFDGIFPEKWDFSFIKNTYFRISLINDYIFFNSLNLWCLIENPQYTTPEFWNSIKHIRCYCHKKNSYEINIKCFQYIHLFGWHEFVIKYQ